MTPRTQSSSPSPTPSPGTLSVTALVASLPHLSMTELWQLWDKHFDDRPGHHHRGWVESRLAYRIQENAFGGMKPSLRKKLQDIGQTGQLPRQLQNKTRLLPGTILTRSYDGAEHRVLVHGGKDFEYLGQRFKSLSAVACHITGTHLSGPAFFGLPTHNGKKERA